jgi:GrpB-like predicted nucleotidyltransferase (UPF0157 family)
MPTFTESVAAGGRQVGGERLDDPIQIVPYDPNWPSRFEDMRGRLAEVLGPTALRIDHVGSTAVPGLSAKAVIDIQLSVPDVEDEAAFKNSIESLGFELRWISTGHRYFRPPAGLPRLTQIHVCTIGSQWERVHLLFRDYLRTHPKTRRDYEELKVKLATEYGDNRIGYADAKTPFVEGTLVTAEEWAKRTDWEP